MIIQKSLPRLEISLQVIENNKLNVEGGEGGEGGDGGEGGELAFLIILSNIML